jgi:hypothetical protein
VADPMSHDGLSYCILLLKSEAHEGVQPTRLMLALHQSVLALREMHTCRKVITRPCSTLSHIHAIARWP